MEKEIRSIAELVDFVTKITTESGNLLVFRGEKKDYGETALVPLVYRDGYFKNEEIIYRESQRFNDFEFSTDKSVFDRLSRIQHYSAPTRLIDVSEDLFSALFFSINSKIIDENDSKKCKCEINKLDAIIYIFEIDKYKIKYYDSDTVSVISNLAKIPSTNKNEKSKEALFNDIKQCRGKIKDFNKCKSVEFLLHEIKDEKPQFDSIIEPAHLTSIQFVLPKLTNNRVRSQKGAFLLFGLNPECYLAPIKLLDNGIFVKSNHIIEHPILNLHTAILKFDHIQTMKTDLKKLGIKLSFIYPEIDKVSESLKE